MKNVTIIGASGAIGEATIHLLHQRADIKSITALSRSDKRFDLPRVITGHIDLADEMTIEKAADLARQNGPQDLVFVTTGFLHEGNIFPEKSIRDLSSEKFHKNFAINTIGPALVAKHFLPIMNKEDRNVFAMISARVGSISDNKLGGWYSYRASKAALNMVIKNLSIEAKRSFKKTTIIGLHPGTVDSDLSKPFQTNVAEGKLFSPEYSAKQMLNIIVNVTDQNSGEIIAWDGKKIEY